MAKLDIAHWRLQNQSLARTKFTRPSEVVAWMGAVQAQDYLGALWAIGLRSQNAVEADIEKALADKTIIRTWPMRGTLHFVAAADIRWMLELLTPRIVNGMKRRLQVHFGLDEATFGRSKELFIRALQGGKQLTRPAMYKVLEAGGIPAGEMRGLHILSRLAQDGVICFGAREGKQPTFALLDEWSPTAKRMERDASLAELAGRYFTSHAPATLQDFIWWSGLTVAEAQAALEMAKPQLVKEVIAGQTYWLASSQPSPKEKSPKAYLLPSYDEYTVAYKDRSAVLNPLYAKQSGNGIFSPTIVIDGQVAGTWKRTIKKDALLITLSPFEKPSKPEVQAVADAADRYGKFLGATVVLQ